MNSYKYTALGSGGREITGLVEAIDELEATAKVRNQYNVVLSIKEIKEGPGIKVPAFLTGEIGGAKLHNKEFTLMCSQFATILSAGIPIARAVKLIGSKTTDRFLKKLLDEVAVDVESGRSLSAAFENPRPGIPSPRPPWSCAGTAARGRSSPPATPRHKCQGSPKPRRRGALQRGPSCR